MPSKRQACVRVSIEAHRRIPLLGQQAITKFRLLEPDPRPHLWFIDEFPEKGFFTGIRHIEQTNAVSWQLKTDVEHALANQYRQNLATALGGEVRDQSKAKNVYVGPGIMTVEHLQCQDDHVFDAIEQFLQKFRELE